MMQSVHPSCCIPWFYHGNRCIATIPTKLGHATPPPSERRWERTRWVSLFLASAVYRISYASECDLFEKIVGLATDAFHHILMRAGIVGPWKAVSLAVNTFLMSTDDPWSAFRDCAILSCDRAVHLQESHCWILFVHDCRAFKLHFPCHHYFPFQRNCPGITSRTVCSPILDIAKHLLDMGQVQALCHILQAALDFSQTNYYTHKTWG